MQSEHRIRLRGGWDYYVVLPATNAAPRRVTLPLPCSNIGGRSFRLERGFQAPPLDAASETLFLQFDDVSGLRSVALNGQTIAQLSGDQRSLLVRLASVNPRGNRLVLEVGPVPRPAAVDAIWGSIALVICRDMSSGGTAPA